MKSNWSTFTCNNPNFKVRSVPDNTVFGVRRKALLNSEVFRDMFNVCDPASADADEPLDLHETRSGLIALLRLLHEPPVAPTEKPPLHAFDTATCYDAATVIPLPLLLSLLFPLADKYSIKENIVSSLKLHLHAHARTHALEVYAYATVNDMEWIASAASQYVLPLASYRFEEIKIIPSVIAYHKLVRLQDFRVKALRDLLLGEEIFPRGYGACTLHGEQTITSWDRQRKALMGRIETVTDVAGEMGALTNTLRECKTCQKACTAAVDMLRYKSFRLPRRFDQLPTIY